MNSTSSLKAGTDPVAIADNAIIADALALLRSGGRAREQGIRKLYERFAAKFERYFQRHRVPAAQAEELVQDVFIRVVKGCEGYRGEAPPAVWLWTIVRNTMLSFHRSSHADKEVSHDDDDEFESMMAERAVDEMPAWVRDCLGRQMARFGQEHPERAECISAIVMKDWGIEELSHFLGRSMAATKEYLSQCRKKLRTFLQECTENEGEYGLE